MTSSKFGRRSVVAVVLALPLLAVDSRDANACGCFTPPDPSVPIVQAGERILFAMENGVVTAHIQIQYAGDAKDFGWLLPLPSVPEMELGTDELFAALTTTTQPKYRLVQKYDGNCGFNPASRRRRPGRRPPGAPAPAAAGADNAGDSPLVIQDSVGPYDYAVLKADSQEDMLEWLADNRYFVPAGTDQTVGAYIRPGAFFLALKLQSRQVGGRPAAGGRPLPADLPMIPIVLTSVAAQPNMGIQVWMLGTGRAIPRNYYHTVINDMAIDWNTSGANYNDVIIKAVGEAPEKHTFVTEYAGDAAVMRNVLERARPLRHARRRWPPARPRSAFIQYLQQNGFGVSAERQSGAIAHRPHVLGPAARDPGALHPGAGHPGADAGGAGSGAADVAAVLPEPELLPVDLPERLRRLAGRRVQSDGGRAEIHERVVKPTLDAGELFDKYPNLTRLYTTLSPQDMNKDPVFSFNATLPDVSNVHEATLTYYCGAGSADRATTPALLLTEQGWSRYFSTGTGQTVLPAPPIGLAVRRLEVLREEGAPEVVTDNPPPTAAARARSPRPTGRRRCRWPARRWRSRCWRR